MGIAEDSADMIPGNHPGPCLAKDAGVMRFAGPDPANSGALPKESGCFRTVMGYEEIRI